MSGHSNPTATAALPAGRHAGFPHALTPPPPCLLEGGTGQLPASPVLYQGTCLHGAEWGGRKGVATTALCPPRAHPAAEDHGAVARLPHATLPRRRRGAGARQDEHEEGRKGARTAAAGPGHGSLLRFTQACHEPQLSPAAHEHLPRHSGQGRRGARSWDDRAGMTGLATLGAQCTAVPADVPQPCPTAAAAVPLPSLAMTQPGARPPPGTGRQPRTGRAGTGVMDALMTLPLCGEGWMRPKLWVKVAASHRCLSPSP